ncbi:MAG: Thiol peroxidase [Owenweeksia sp. TMED14]|nr:MAG: Thiol peroxidase [Owenweeksia sp. TMED14]
MANITFGGNPALTVGDLPAAGIKAQDFKLTSGDLSEISLSDFIGETIVLNIFPSIGTGVCQNSVRKFNELVTSLNNVTVLNISRDMPFSLQQWCGAEGLENVLVLSELRDDDFSKKYHVRMIDTKFASLFSRCIIILNPKGIVVYTEQVSEIGNEPDYGAALKAIKQIQI